MKDRPILFSSSMIVALLAGTKTQTRRVLKPQPEHHWSALPGYRLDMTAQPVEGGLAVRPVHSIPTRPFADSSPRATDLSPWVPCRYGAPGDELWVRETFVYRSKHDRYYYRADHPVYDPYAHDGWKPSIHMPRRASRITLEVVAVWVERLHEITDDDARAEGVQPFTGVAPDQVVPGPGFDGARLGDQPHRLPYADLWRAINGPEAWDSNPWVWVIEFKRVKL
jgi:hypothetical protein